MYESDLLQLVCEERYSFDIKEPINDLVVEKICSS